MIPGTVGEPMGFIQFMACFLAIMAAVGFEIIGFIVFVIVAFEAIVRAARNVK